MKRRSFLKWLMLAPLVAVPIVKATIETIEEEFNPNKSLRTRYGDGTGYQGSDDMDAGFIYVPYIPLIRT